MTQQAKKWFSVLLKVAVAVFAIWFIYIKLTDNNDLKKFVTLLSALPRLEIWATLFVLVLLMFMNWGLEAIKWKKLVRQIETISLWRAIESVFCGLTWAVFTPNRIGEYGGRVFFLSPKRRIAGVVAMAVGQLGQLVTTNVFGAIALSIFIFSFDLLDYRLCIAVFAIATVFSSFFLVFYFNIRWLNGFLLSFNVTRRYKKFYIILARYKKVELLKILLFCLCRYLIFSTQYLIVFHLFLPEVAIVHIFMLTCILFFVQAYLPSIAFLDLGIKSITALFFFKFVTTQNAAVVACMASIWLINIIIPAILGLYFVFKLNFFGSQQHHT